MLESFDAKGFSEFHATLFFILLKLIKIQSKERSDHFIFMNNQKMTKKKFTKIKYGNPNPKNGKPQI